MAYTRKHNSPEENASFLNQKFFVWMFAFFKQGSRSKLTIDDIYPLKTGWSSEELSKRWKKEWEPSFQEYDRNRAVRVKDYPSLIIPIFRMFRSIIIPALGVRITEDIVHFAKPVMLSLLIDYLITDAYPIWYGLLIALGTWFCGQLRSTCYSIFSHTLISNYTQILNTMRVAIYDKTMRLSNEARSGRSTGEIVNFMTSDVVTFAEGSRWVHNLISAPLEFTLAIYLLWNQIGKATIAAVIVISCVVPFDYWCLVKSTNLQEKRMKAKDERIKTSNEMLNGMKLIKFNGWESVFMKKISELRKKEVDLRHKMRLITETSERLNAVAPFLMAVVCFSLYIYSDESNTLTPKIVLVSLTLFNQLEFPMTLIAQFIHFCGHALVANGRLKEFMASPERINQVNIDYMKDLSIDANGASFGWNCNETLLKNISLKIDKGSCTVVVGSVGSGKSSLLSAISGEMDRLSGSVTVSGKIAIVSQQPWLMNTTIRENILFGKDYDHHLYKEVVQACELQLDLERMSDGDHTVVGDNGSSLSGGQRSRVSLARALYQDADIYLLDDPLSAIDRHIGLQIYKNVISNQGMLKNRTRILTTNNGNYVKDAKQVLLIEDGQITERGTVEEMRKKSDLFNTMVMNSTKEDGKVGISSEEIPAQQLNLKRESTCSRAEDEPLLKNNEKISLNVWRSLYEAASMKNVLLFPFFNLIAFIIQTRKDIYISSWSSNTEHDHAEAEHKLLIYILLGSIELTCIVLCTNFFLRACKSAAVNIHDPFLKSILTLPVTFFDSTPVGEILSRLSQDLNSVDEKIPNLFNGMTVIILKISSVIFVISYACPLFLLVLALLMIIYSFVLKHYLATTRQLRLLEKTYQSPIVSYFGEALNGANILRSYEKVEWSKRQFSIRSDNFSKVKYMLFVANRWLCTYMDIMANLIVLSAAVFAVISVKFFGTSPTVAALSLSYAFSLDMLNVIVSYYSDIDNQAISLYRLREYEDLEKESDLPSSIDKHICWIDNPSITCERLSLRYGTDLPIILSNLNIDIRAHEKIAVVGRTGSGKSSLTMALFRMIDPCFGRILINGIDISTVPLHKLRASLAIIPQDPFLFSGSLRFNLDPFQIYSNEQLWDALDKCQLKDIVSGMEGGLDCDISEGARNLSVGQRQLLCLARVLLNRAKIIILDEATSSIDSETMSLVHQVIHDRFSSSTVINVTHRLESIQGYDKLLRLDKGQAVEFRSMKNE